MKKTVLYMISAIFLLACASDSQSLEDPSEAVQIASPYTADGGIDSSVISQMAHLEFKDRVHDFGTIRAGEVVLWDVEFTNTGKGDAIIQDAEASCGCTVPEYDKEPIASGKTGKIKIKFNSEGNKGTVEKQVHVETNAYPASYVLTIKANIQ